MVLGKLFNHMQKKEIRTLSNTIHKKWTQKDLRSKCKIRNCKTPRGKHRQNTDINHSRILYDPPPIVMEIKAKINKWDLIKLKSCCTTKENISKVKRQPSEWEKIIANEATDQELISKIYKQLLRINSRKINDPIKKRAKELNRHFSKEDIQMANKTWKDAQHHLLLEKSKSKP